MQCNGIIFDESRTNLKQIVFQVKQLAVSHLCTFDGANV